MRFSKVFATDLVKVYFFFKRFSKVFATDLVKQEFCLRNDI